jgi:integrase
MEQYAKRHKSSWRNDEGYLTRHVRPVWGDWPASAITKQNAAQLLAQVKEKTGTGANRTRSVLAKLFNWATDEGLLEMSPMVGVKKPHKEAGGRTRILSDAELRVVWRALDSSGLSPNTVAALKILALLGQRPGEIAGMHRAELTNLDRASEARWEIPAARMKARRPHVVPLPSMAREIILAQLQQSDSREGYVFASRFATSQRIARHSLSQAMKRVIMKLDRDVPDGETVQQLQENPPTPHDLRRTVVTKLAAFGVLREDRLAIVAHSWGDVHEAHYDRYERLKEKRAALEIWERHVQKVLEAQPSTATVVTLTTRR